MTKCSTIKIAMLAGLVLGGAAVAPARADVRSGVTAWEAGDYPQAVREWRPLAVAGDADAQFNLGQAYKLGRGVPVDLAQAAAWFRRAADQGHLQAQDNLGLVLFDMGQKGDAIPYLQQSAERGEPRAQFVMGAELFNGEWISRDLPRAYAFMKRASDAGLQRAAAALVQMDGAIPLDQRQQGLTIAAAMETSEGQARLTAMTATAPPRPVRPQTIRTAALPPSQAGTTYAGPPMAAPVATTPSRPAAVAVTIPAVEGEFPGLSASIGNRPSAAENRPAPAPVQAGTASVAAPRAVAAAPVAARAAAGGAWRIQLGAFASRARAQSLWSGLTGRLPGATADYVAAGAVTRLQAGPYATRAEAARACTLVRPAACFVVAR